MEGFDGCRGHLEEDASSALRLILAGMMSAYAGDASQVRRDRDGRILSFFAGNDSVSIGGVVLEAVFYAGEQPYRLFLRPSELETIDREWASSGIGIRVGPALYRSNRQAEH